MKVSDVLLNAGGGKISTKVFEKKVDGKEGLN